LSVNILESNICETAFRYIADSRIFTKNIGGFTLPEKSNEIMPNKCRYIKTGGVRCGAIALTEKQFCFWHTNINRRHAEAKPSPKYPKFYNSQNELKHRQKDHLADDYYSASRINGPTADELPPLEDPESIQLAISMVLASLADFRIETKRANLMLYALRLAMMNEPRIRPAAENSVTDIVTNEFGVEMAAPRPTDPSTETVISTEAQRSGETAVLAPAHVHEATTNSPGYVMSPSPDASPGLVMSASEAA
jgi:hypothetical protein